MSKLIIGNKYVPLKKSVCGNLNSCVAWKNAKGMNQPYLYYNGLSENGHHKFNETTEDTGDYFLEDDVIPYMEEFIIDCRDVQIQNNKFITHKSGESFAINWNYVLYPFSDDYWDGRHPITYSHLSIIPYSEFINKYHKTEKMNTNTELVTIPEDLFFEGQKAMNSSQSKLFMDNVNPWKRECTKQFVIDFYNTQACNDWKVKIEGAFPFVKTPVFSTWEQAMQSWREKGEETYYVASYDTISKDGPYSSVENRSNSVLSEKRAKSVAAYIKLSVLVDSINNELNVVPDNTRSIHTVAFNDESKKLELQSYVRTNTNSLYFKKNEDAKNSIVAHKDLWMDFFMQS